MATAEITRQSVVPELDLDGIDGVLGLHIGTVNTLFVSRLEKHLDPLRVTPKQVAILWLVNANPGVKQTDLSRFFQIERPTVHQFVRQLIKNSFLVNEPSKLDRRAGGLWLTDEGREVLAKARSARTPPCRGRHRPQAAPRQHPSRSPRGLQQEQGGSSSGFPGSCPAFARRGFRGPEYQSLAGARR